jgi:hypothetical protein
MFFFLKWKEKTDYLKGTKITEIPYLGFPDLLSDGDILQGHLYRAVPQVPPPLCSMVITQMRNK